MRKHISIRLLLTVVSAVTVFAVLILSAVLIEKTADRVLEDTTFALDEKNLQQIAENIAEEEAASELYLYALMRDSELTNALDTLMLPEFINYYEINQVEDTIRDRLNAYKLAQEQISVIALYSEDFFCSTRANRNSMLSSAAMLESLALVDSGPARYSEFLQPGSETTLAWENAFGLEHHLGSGYRIIHQPFYGYDGLYIAVLMNNNFYSNAVQSNMLMSISTSGGLNLYNSRQKALELLALCANDLKSGALRTYCSDGSMTYRVTTIHTEPYRMTCFTECSAILSHMETIRRDGLLIAALVFIAVILIFSLPLQHILNQITAFVQYVSEYPSGETHAFPAKRRSILRRVTAYFVTLLCASTLAFNAITVNRTLAEIRTSSRNIYQSFVENQRYFLDSLNQRSREAVSYIVYSTAFQQIVLSSGAMMTQLPYEQYAYLSTLKCDVNLYSEDGRPVFYMSLASLNDQNTGNAEKWCFGEKNRLDQPVIRYNAVMRATEAGPEAMPLEKTGYIEIVYPQSYLDPMLKNMTDMQLDCRVVSSDGTLIVSNTDDDGSDALFPEEDWFEVSFSNIPVTILARETEDAIARIADPFARISRSIILFMLLMCFCVTHLIARTLRTQIDRLVLQLEGIGQGAAAARTELAPRSSISEIERLYQAFQSMAARIDELIQVEYAAKLKEALLINERNAIEISSLQAQINPHFIYNTLDTVKWLMLQGRKTDCEHALNALARLMRYSMMVNQPLVTIADEIRMIQAYSEVQRFRLDSVPDIVYRIYPAVQENAAIRMILQPLLENAYVHAFPGQSAPGIILITAREANGIVEIRIEDNGVGIAGDRLKQLLAGLSSPEENDGHGIGLFNVNRRIQVYFGEEYGLSLTSAEGEGTCVTVRLPKQRRSSATVVPPRCG